MNLIFQNNTSSDKSFGIQTIKNIGSKIDWHHHIEYEIILFTNGSGKALIANNVTEFKCGDIYFLGPNLPHAFHADKRQLISAIILHFREDFLGNRFLYLPECLLVCRMLQSAKHGLKLPEKNKTQLQSLLTSIESSAGIKRIIIILECLQIIVEATDFDHLSLTKTKTGLNNNKAYIDKVINFTYSTFQKNISLRQVAEISCMSVPSFCNYFKMYTQKTYNLFLNEVRISYACNQLIETPRPIVDICYDSGYNSIAHFYKQFQRLIKMPPLQFRISYQN